MLIAQVSDIHIDFHRDHPDEPNLKRLRQVLDRLVNRPDRPDLLLLTGDLTEHGDAASFAELKAALAALPFPVWPIPGNHDARAALAGAFAQVPQDGGFLHYAVEVGGLRILMLDSLEQGRHSGAFCAARGQWLCAQLSAHLDTPTLVVIHHPPVVSGIDWMDPGSAEPWIARLGDALAGQRQVKAILCGHLHRPMATTFAGIPLIICPSSAAALALQLDAIDPGHADGRAMIIDEPPGFALHHWDGERLVTHFALSPAAPVLVTYDAKFKPLVQQMLSERD